MKYLMFAAMSCMVIGCGGASHSDLFDPPVSVEDGGTVVDHNDHHKSHLPWSMDAGNDVVDSGNTSDVVACVCSLSSSPPEMCGDVCYTGYGCLAEEGLATENTYRSWYQSCDKADPAYGSIYVGGSDICLPDQAGYVRGCLIDSRAGGQTESCQINVMEDGGLVSKSGRCVK